MSTRVFRWIKTVQDFERRKERKKKRKKIFEQTQLAMNGVKNFLFLPPKAKRDFFFTAEIKGERL